MFHPKLLALAVKTVPPALYRRLDPVEAALQAFVRDAARATPAGARVLDAGAGECRFRGHFAHARYVGLDARVGDSARDYGRLDAVARLEALPIPDGAFDRVLCIQVLEHAPDPRQVLAELARVLGPRGRLDVAVPMMWEEHERPHDYYRYTGPGLRRLLEGAGFRVTELAPIGGFFWVLGRRLMGVLAFAQRGWRWALFPLLAPVFGLALPLACYYLDRLDRDRAYTLGYLCRAERARTLSPGTAPPPA